LIAACHPDLSGRQAWRPWRCNPVSAADFRLPFNATSIRTIMNTTGIHPSMRGVQHGCRSKTTQHLRRTK
jgi:hypothetical protein